MNGAEKTKTNARTTIPVAIVRSARDCALDGGSPVRVRTPRALSRTVLIGRHVLSWLN